MSDFTIEQLEALKEGITPGPWEATKDDILRAGWRDRLLKKCPWYAEDEWEDEISYMASSDEFVLSNPESHYKPLTDNRADMELVASVPELLDALIAEKRAHAKLRAEVEAMREDWGRKAERSAGARDNSEHPAKAAHARHLKAHQNVIRRLTSILGADNG